MKKAESQGPVVAWLCVLLLMLVALTAVGGITRLTESGLSIVDWDPLMGVVPPLDEEAWEATFEAYRAYPQYRRILPDLDLAGFKRIFFWEYLHRLLARGVGVVYLVPFLAFLFRRRISGGLAVRLSVGFVLGGLQGLLGWFMVLSGLKDMPYVSHLRLAAHLSLAFFITMYLWWILLDLLREGAPAPGAADHPALRRGAWGLIALLAVQIVYGAFVAGLDAGRMFNTFPTMLGRWVPPGLMAFEPAWVNFFRNATLLQFIHRLLAWGLVFGAVAYAFCAFAARLSGRQLLAVAAVLLLTLVQFILGVATLLLRVPVSLGTLHQVTALLLLGAAVAAAHAFRRRPAL